MGRLRTICEVHRQLWRRLQPVIASDPVVGELLQEAYDMGKKMDNRLRCYKHNYDEGWWQANRLAGGPIDQPETGGAP